MSSSRWVACSLWLVVAFTATACKEKRCPPGQMEYSGHCLLPASQNESGEGAAGSGGADAAAEGAAAASGAESSAMDMTGVETGASGSSAADGGATGTSGMSGAGAAGASGVGGESAGDTPPPGCIASSEYCDSKDNDCDGQVDEMLTRPCGPPSRGQCKPGTETCENGRWSACTGGNEPVAEVCDAERNDENCDGSGNEGCACSAGEQKPCERSEGICIPGQQYCLDGTWGRCEGASSMTVEVCDPGERDEDCDGMSNEGCECTQGQTDRCDTGRDGACSAGIKMCAGGKWGECVGMVAPNVEVCDSEGVDEDCDGMVDEGCCRNGEEQSCTTDRQGSCRDGTRRCSDGEWSACESRVEPAAERCDGMDNDCNGTADDGEPCPNGQRCVERQCVGCTRATEATDCPNDDPCRRNRCTDRGACESQPVQNGTACETDDGEGMCMNGACLPEAQTNEDEVVCYVHGLNGSARTEPTRGITFRQGPVGLMACLPGRGDDGCNDWFGLCETRNTRMSIEWALFDADHANMVGARSVTHSAPGQAYGSTSQINPRTWFGTPRTDDGRAVECRLFDNPDTPRAGRYREFFVGPNNRVCANDATCATAFGLCEVVD